MFLPFMLLSGAGWLCDFCTFTVLIKLMHWPPFTANLASSYAGVTFVWLTSLKAVFGRTSAASYRFLLIYWGYQLVSILAYSQGIHWGVSSINSLSSPDWLTAQPAIFVKVIVTPLNLITNFLFMKFLTRFMQAATV